MTVSVRVPASSANLGPGFDTLGLALALYDEVSAEVIDGETTVTIHGEGAGELPTDEQHLVVRAMGAAFDELGLEPPNVALTCHNRIPQARGLGSSSAAIVAGVLLARALAASEPDTKVALDDDGVLRLAARMEGHPDNVAACLRGGFTIAWVSAGSARAVRLLPDETIQPTVFVPEQRGLTTVARAVLPPTIPHADAAHAAGRAALLVHAITRDPSHLLDATEDRLHQHYRGANSPATAALVARLRAAGVAAVVSGAGPSVLALSPVPPDFELEPGWLRHVLAVDRDGAVVKPGMIAPYAGKAR
ncbi:MAG TPA: homoserine kinase [Natronosporangium sp.]